MSPVARTVAVLTSCLSLLGSVHTALAQVSDHPLQLNVPAGSLANALDTLGDQSGVQIMYEPSLIRGITVAGIHETLTVSDALKRLVGQHGLRADRVNDKTVVLKRSDTVRVASSTMAEDDSMIRRAAEDALSVPQEEVIVSAEKRGEERLQDTPIPIAVVNADALAETSQVALRDYFTSVPGLSVTPDTSMGQEVAIRGITQNSGIPTVGILIDDIPFGSATVGSGNNVPDLDPGDLARIEVLRGPQGTLYGANSMGGLLRYVTNDPSTAQFSGRVEAGTSDVYNGAEPGFNLRGSLNVPVTDSLAVRASAYTRQDPGYIDNVVQHIRGINEVEAFGGRLAALWEPSDAVYLKLTAMYQNTRGNGLPEINRAVNGYSGFAAGFPSSVAASLFPSLGDLQQIYVTGVDKYSMVSQVYSAALKLKLGAVDFTSDSGYTIQHQTAPFDFTPFLGPLYLSQNYGVYGAPLETTTNLDKVSEEIRFSGGIGPNFDWVAGGFYTRESESPQSHQSVYVADATSGQAVSVFYDGTSQDTYQEYAAFVNLTYRFTDRFNVQIGGRENHTRENASSILTGPYISLVEGTTPPVVSVTSANSNAFTYLLTPQLKVSPDLMVYARLASGTRPGGGNVAPVSAIPSQFSPDKTYNYEVGLKGDFLDHRLSVDTSVYYIDWKNMQVSSIIGAFGFQTNGGTSKSEGVEFSFQARPLTGLAFSGWVDYEHAVLTADFPANSTAYGVSGERLPNTPKYAAELSVQQSFPLVGKATGFVGAAASYVGERLGLFLSCGGPCTAAPTRDVYPSYTRTDLRAGVEYDTWTTSLYANNVANVRGIVNGGNSYLTPYVYFVIPPRTVGVSVAKKF